MNGSRPSQRCFSGPCMDVPAWKRILDVFCIPLATPLLVFLGILIALAIKVLSPGPIFFKQERIGLFGRRFMCLKFRTMLVNADVSVHRGHLITLMTSDR